MRHARLLARGDCFDYRLFLRKLRNYLPQLIGGIGFITEGFDNVKPYMQPVSDIMSHWPMIIFFLLCPSIGDFCLHILI